MVISGGINIFPKEVEEVIAAFPGVAQVAVVGLPDERWGEAVTAAVVPREGHTLDPQAIAASVRERKGPVHEPKRIVMLNQLPLTPLGKVDKKTLRAQLKEST
jgi:fatty-acyl-CoA synthase